MRQLSRRYAIAGVVVAAGLAGLIARAEALAPTGLQHQVIGAAAPDFAAQGADGQTHRLSDYRGKTIVLEWTSPVCEFTARKYGSGAMQALQREARERGVVWLSVNTAGRNRLGFMAGEKALQRVEKTGATVTAFLLDSGGDVGLLYGAKTTPSFVIVQRDGRLAYQGAMDDNSGDDGTHAHNYVRAALRELGAGRPVTVAETRPYGCAVEY